MSESGMILKKEQILKSAIVSWYPENPTSSEVFTKFIQLKSGMSYRLNILENLWL